MKITILNKQYDINSKILNLSHNQFESLPAKIGNLINLQILYL